MENTRLKSHISSTDNYSMAALFVQSLANLNNKNNVSVHKQAVFLHLANLGVRDLKVIAGTAVTRKKQLNHLMRKAVKLESYKILIIKQHLQFSSLYDTCISFLSYLQKYFIANLQSSVVYIKCLRGLKPTKI